MTDNEKICSTTTLFMEYLAQVNTIVIIAFLVWRVETLQELESEENE